jgi:hypothetical protein
MNNKDLALPAEQDRAVAADAAEPEVSALRASIPSARNRDHRGRFLRSVRMTPDGSCEWLIWSKYWRAWHRKSRQGGACGYTDDIAEAGLFPREMAVAYNDDRDTPYHVSEKMFLITAAIAKHEAALASLRQLSSGKSS